MLRISKLADYATLIMAYAARTPDMPLTAKKTASDLGLQYPTVSKILKRLAKANLLISMRGAQGGYQLAHVPTEINIAEIISVMDGPIALTKCSHVLLHCTLSQNCTTKNNWQSINQIIYEKLAEVSLADMVNL